MTAQAKSREMAEQSPFQRHVSHALREGMMWSLFCLSGYLLLSLFTYSAQDPGWSYTGPSVHVMTPSSPVSTPDPPPPSGRP